MAITVVCGISSYPIRIASTFTGVAGSEEPDGLVCYLLPLVGSTYKLANPNRNKPKIGGASEYPSGKRSIQFPLKVKMIENGGNSVIDEIDALNNFMYTYTIKQSSPKCYLFYYDNVCGQYMKLSWNGSHTHLKYLKGFFASIDTPLKPGKSYEMPITFREATSP